jgi:hypothetical protein
MDPGAGVNARASPAYDCRMALFIPLKYTGTKPPESGGKNSRSNTCFELAMAKTQTKQFVICIDNADYSASLEKRKIYIALRDTAAEKHGLLRIIDESGEDYLYAKKSFRPIALPKAVKKAVLAA